MLGAATAQTTSLVPCHLPGMSSQSLQFPPISSPGLMSRMVPLQGMTFIFTYPSSCGVHG
eukprot:1093908-Rhodomonas_salina.1